MKWSKKCNFTQLIKHYLDFTQFFGQSPIFSYLLPYGSSFVSGRNLLSSYGKLIVAESCSISIHGNLNAIHGNSIVTESCSVLIHGNLKVIHGNSFVSGSYSFVAHGKKKNTRKKKEYTEIYF